jgi:hypothetical protein
VDEAVDEDLPRQPRARPDNTVGGETILASLEASDEDVSTPLPKSRPVQADAAATTKIDGEDAIASLAERMNQESPESTADAGDPIALAFAAASDAPQPAEADRAILAAFATLADSDAIRPPDPDLSAALTLRAAEENPPQQQPAVQPTAIAVAYADSDLLLRTSEPQVTGTVAEPKVAVVDVPEAPLAEPGPAVVAAAEPVVAKIEPAVVQSIPAVAAEPEQAIVTDQEPGTIVLASADAPTYDGDEPTLLNLIETSAVTPASTEGELAMPKPASGLLVAPEGASAVADLRGQAGPPVDRFTRNGGTQPEEGFLSKLFASLVQ